MPGRSSNLFIDGRFAARYADGSVADHFFGVSLFLNAQSRRNLDFNPALDRDPNNDELLLIDVTAGQADPNQPWRFVMASDLSDRIAQNNRVNFTVTANGSMTVSGSIIVPLYAQHLMPAGDLPGTLRETNSGSRQLGNTQATLYRFKNIMELTFTDVAVYDDACGV